MRTLLITPPLLELHLPYPATAYLTAFLRSSGQVVAQEDASIDLILSLFSESGLQRICDAIKSQANQEASDDAVFDFIENLDSYKRATVKVLRFLQGEQTLSEKILGPEFFPAAFRRNKEFFQEKIFLKREISKGSEINRANFRDGRSLSEQEYCRIVCTRFLNFISRWITEYLDPCFELESYGLKQFGKDISFADLFSVLNSQPSIIREALDPIITDYLRKHQPRLVAITIPFFGCLLGAFQIAQTIKKIDRSVKIAIGGGLVNTQLRSVSEKNVFQYVDFICLDDGEQPLLELTHFLEGKVTRDKLIRTYLLNDEGQIEYTDQSGKSAIKQSDLPTPTYAGLDRSKYLSLLGELSPIHRLWRSANWNKLTIAHGCYWKKCAFCDIHLDYINRYESSPAEIIVKRMKDLIEETGLRNFHFTDEACPPAILHEMAKKLIEKDIQIKWWGNVRFEKYFTGQVAHTLAQSGCVAVTAGLETASDRLLKMMNKGVDLSQVARVANAFTQAGILVHAYLMFGFLTQTLQETLDSLEFVRQLFKEELIDSASWSRFTLTEKSDIGLNPSRYGIQIKDREASDLSSYWLKFDDSKMDCDPVLVQKGLHDALDRYIHGLALDLPVKNWFSYLPSSSPDPTLPNDFVKLQIVSTRT